MHWIFALVGLLHLLFMVLELFPWHRPFSLGREIKRLPRPPKGQDFTSDQQQVVDRHDDLAAAIVHNAGIYNGIVAAGLFWAAFGPEPALAGRIDVARVMLAGAVVAGAFGTVTLKNPVPAVQAVFGVGGLVASFILV
jgi:putative membrane protein